MTPKFEDGEEVLTIYRGKWTHVKWSGNGWSLGYAQPFVPHFEGREYAPIPSIQSDDLDFYQNNKR